MQLKTLAAVASVLLGAYSLFGSSPAPLAQKAGGASGRIAWYATLKSGLAEAKRSNRPILFTSAAPQCEGVSGIW